MPGDLDHLDVTIGPPGPGGACELKIAFRVPLPALPEAALGQVPGTAPSPGPAAKWVATPNVGRGPHGLVLSRITSDPKRWTAARVIALLREIPLADAYKLTSRTIIPVLNGVTLEEAEKALELFKALRISGRITTKRAV